MEAFYLHALSLSSCQLVLRIGCLIFCRLIDQGSEVQLEGFAQGQTASKWQSQNSKPGCYVPRGAGTHPWSGAEVCLTLQATVSSLVSFSPFPPQLLPITKASDTTIRARALKSQLQESRGSLSSLLPALSQGPRTPGLVEAAQGAFVR